jgi:hypothetical protein
VAQTDSVRADVRPIPWKTSIVDALTALSPGVLLGVLCGALIGGVGGRLAMLLLRLTSDDALHGMKTDDEFTIGAITGDSLFLLAATAFMGLVGGLVYLAVREWLPENWRPILFGILGGAVGGAAVIRPGGTDFTALEPLSLAVALFVILPAVYGATLSVLVERLRHSTRFRRGWLRWAGAIPLLLPVLVGAPVGLGMLVLFALVVSLNRFGHVSRLWHSTPTRWVGRLAFTVVLVGSSVELARKVAEVL